MASDKHHIFTAKTINDILFQLKTISNLKIIGGGTYITDFPEKFLSIRNNSELTFIDKHERFIDFGPAVTLNNMLHLGPNYLPSILYEALFSISNHAVRNMATLGGNIMAKDPRLTLIAPLAVLDASLKFKNQKSFDIIPVTKLDTASPESVLVSVRIPTKDWNVEIFKRLGPSHKITADSASFCFLAKTEKNILINLRLCFSGPFIFQSKQLETNFLGIRLPLSQSKIHDFIETASCDFDESAKGVEYDPILKQQFLNLIAHSLHELT